MYETAVLVVGHLYGYFDNKNLLKVGAALSVVTYIILMLLVSLKRPLSGLAQCRRADGQRPRYKQMSRHYCRFSLCLCCDSIRGRLREESVCRRHAPASSRHQRDTRLVQRRHGTRSSDSAPVADVTNVCGPRQAAQDDLLARNPAADVRVFVVWFRMYPGDQESRWPRGYLPAFTRHPGRDEPKAAGRWFLSPFLSAAAVTGRRRAIPPARRRALGQLSVVRARRLLEQRANRRRELGIPRDAHSPETGRRSAIRAQAGCWPVAPQRRTSEPGWLPLRNRDVSGLHSRRRRG